LNNFILKNGSLFVFSFYEFIDEETKNIDSEYQEVAEEIKLLLQNTAQLYLQPCQTNYYNGSNQTELEPDVVFVSEKEEWETTINGIKY
jgi:DNA-directed RNA polymerase specialized sigma54-like protein